MKRISFWNRGRGKKFSDLPFGCSCKMGEFNGVCRVLCFPTGDGREGGRQVCAHKLHFPTKGFPPQQISRHIILSFLPLAFRYGLSNCLFAATYDQVKKLWKINLRRRSAFSPINCICIGRSLSAAAASPSSTPWHTQTTRTSARGRALDA